MSFCVSGVALCDIPTTCLMPCWKLSKLEEVSHEMFVFLRPRVSSRVSGFSCGLAVTMGKGAKPVHFKGFQAGCHVVLRGRRGTLWHSNLFDNASKASKLEEVSHKMLLLLRAHVLFRVSGYPVASPSLWGEATTPHSRLYTPHSTIYTLDSTLYTLHFTLHTLHFALYTPHSTLYTPHSSLDTLHSTLHTVHSTLHALHFILYTLHSKLHTLNFTLHTLHFTLLTPHTTLSTPHSTLHTLHSTLHTPQFTL